MADLGRGTEAVAESPMKVVLCGVAGAGASVAVPLSEGVAVSVGRSQEADVALPGDGFLSGLHFAVEVRDGVVQIRDLGSRNGTFVNEGRITEYVLLQQDLIRAGSSTFRVQVEGEGADLVEALSTLPEPLYMVVDTARDPKIYPLLCGSGARYYSLYLGRSAAELEHVAPYLVQMAPRSEMLREFVSKGWGNAWGILLTSSRPVEEIWKQLRRPLMVTLEEDQKQVYFRFYDPRVLRVFLPVADAAQAAEFGGPISSVMMEDEDPEVLLRFQISGGAAQVSRVKVTVRAGG